MSRTLQIRNNTRLMKIIIVILIISTFFSAITIAIQLMKIQPSYTISVVSVEFTGNPINHSDMDNITWLPYSNYPIISPSMPTEGAGDAGNLYAPDILLQNDTYRMWYGAQSEDGNDQIHYAVSDDAIRWQKYGVVIPNEENNHVNDPSVVYVNDTYYMFYTTAPEAELDVISMAKSYNGINWTIIGNVFLPDSVGKWDSLKVGRPSVLYEENMFKMWYDGMEVDPVNLGHAKPDTGRHVGYATSYDGISWTRYWGNPIYLNGGAVDVENISDYYYIVQESGQGTLWSVSKTSNNETEFEVFQFLFNKTGLDWDKYGHVTPFILKENNKWVATYVGVTTDRCWCQNRIGVWYPMTKVQLVNPTGDIILANEIYAGSKTQSVFKFTHPLKTDCNIDFNTDGSWECRIRIMNEQHILTQSELITMYPNQLSTSWKNSFLYSDDEHRIYRANYM
jgi:hypothetical protein